MGLTKSQIQAAKPGDRLNAGKGLLLVAGVDSKSWRLRFKRDGKDAIVTLGQWPDLSLAEAEAEAASLRLGRKKGVDPAAALGRKAAATGGAGSFQDVAERYMQREAAVWSVGHAERFGNRMRKDAFAVFGSMPIGEVTARDVMRLHARIAGRDALDTANRVVGMVGQVLRFAVARGLRDSDCTAHLKGGLDHAPRPVHRAALTDPDALGQLLADLSEWDGDTIARPLLQLTGYLFQRPGEVRAMRWADLDLERGLWSYRVTKVGIDHIVPLPVQAVAILRELQAGSGKSPFVFASRSDTGYVSAQLAPKLLEKLGYRESHTAHGFRASARTLLVEALGYDSELVERQLSHVVRAVHGRAYDRTLFLRERTAMMQSYADYLDSLRDKALGLAALA